MSEKIQKSFYLLKEKYISFNETTQKFKEEVIDFIFLQKYFRTKNYNEQETLPNLSNEYEFKLFYKKLPSSPPWKGFIRSIAKEDQRILEENKSFSESYLIVVKSISSNQYFVTTGGYGHISIQDLSTTDFGIEILSRLLKKEDKALKATKERSLTGGIQGAVKIFRNDYNFYENDNFGSVYNELNATIDKKQLVDIFGFSSDEITSNCFCIAKDSFSIKKSISFEELIQLIKQCEIILTRDPIVEINNVEKVSKLSKALITKLYHTLYSNIYTNYCDHNTPFSVEISHKEFDKYYYANHSILKFTINRKTYTSQIFEPIKDIQTLLDKIREINETLSIEEFKDLLEKKTTEITTYDENGYSLTCDTLKNHFCTEIAYKGESYFLIEKEWYKIKNTFVNSINEQAEAFTKNNKYGGEINKWKTKMSENEYNSSYFGQPSTLVFDKFTPLNIEACDVMKWDDQNIYFIHVKKGFDNSMRDLCQQIFIAARKIQEDIKSDYSYLSLLYDTVVNNGGQSHYNISAKSHLSKIIKEEFINLFQDKRKIVFVLAVLDTAKTKRNLDAEITKFDSNIAKFSLSELCKNMRSLNVELQITQIVQN
ncbi:DUF6119 family protein [Dysgonomonas mossii]|uniref:DUF6119 family protein n=1 Tax=Dysgonomonas mossii TaxID=163665 RepID=UPI00399376D1